MLPSEALTPQGIEALRMCVQWCRWQNETFLQQFTAGELLRLWRFAFTHPYWPEFADMWCDDEICEALASEEGL